ncbi:MAG TPA: alpha/beta fold hydrolase [Tepidiformaceae bacterium]|nr:alpha/beta fold hydrolase [Tepidiformaceae bacterium]
MPETNASGWTIHWESRGDPATPPIVMILGLSHRIAHWGRLPDLLAERMHVVLFDCRGMGESERRDEPYTIADEVRDVLAVMDAAGVERGAVYGRSRGGMLAQEFALSHPERVTNLVLSGTSHRGPGSVGSNERVNRAMNFTPEMSREEIFATQDEAMASPGWRGRDPVAFNYCLATDLEAPPRRFAVVRQQEAFANWTSHGRLQEIACPTLVVCGEDDGMVPPENSHQLAEMIPGARLALIPQCGHLPMLEKPEAVRDRVFEFLGPS